MHKALITSVRKNGICPLGWQMDPTPYCGDVKVLEMET